ncbi:MAG: ABC transporter ATP-binding protein [Pseudomonadales bacterium]|nr:ABC transporter ATP-binding protein [Pseudomonadales bacterium]
MTQAAVEITGLHKTYRGGFEALKGIDLRIEQGDFFALLGPNGAGKSTTIGVLCSLVKKTQGQVSIFGIDIDKNFPLAKSKIGVVPQEFNFNNFEKVKQIVQQQAGYYGLTAAEAEPKIDHFLKKLGLWEKRDVAARTLSGGMKRRLMIARALIHEPELLILDEPTAGVDIELRRGMWEFLSEINAQGTTIILTTHYLEEAEMLCRNIAIIDAGKIAHHSDMRSLLAQLQQETLLIDLDSTVDQLAPERLANLPYQANIADAQTLEVTISKGQSLNAVFASLSEIGLTATSLRNKANRLEELFVKLIEGEQ